MIVFITILIMICLLFAGVCKWHYALVEQMETIGVKQWLYKIVKSVLICDTGCVITTFMMGIANLLLYYSTHRFDDRLFLILYTSLVLIALVGSLWMIVNELMQIKIESLNLKLSIKYIISIILILSMECLLFYVGFFLWLVAGWPT